MTCLQRNIVLRTGQIQTPGPLRPCLNQFYDIVAYISEEALHMLLMAGSILIIQAHVATAEPGMCGGSV